jgi:hypothetical protein
MSPGIFRQGERTSDAPHFAPPDEPCPVSELHAVLKQVNRNELNRLQNSFLAAAFSNFFQGVTPAGKMSEMVDDVARRAGRHAEHENRVPRRYDGDQTLPSGRYSIVCLDSSGNDGGSLAREMAFYMSPPTAEGHIEVYDGTVPEHNGMIERLGMASHAPRIALHYLPFEQGSGRLNGFTSGIELEVREVRIGNVLDLRRSAAAKWLCRTISRLCVLMSSGSRERCFQLRPDLDDPVEMWPSLMDQARGGGNFHKIVGLYLRALGVSGLVFPCARSDARVTVVSGEPTDHYGWAFVDYRGAPDTRIVAFFELRPDWPSGLMIEGGDDNQPHPPAFADEVTFTHDGFASGDGYIGVQGIEQRLEATRLAQSAEAAALDRVPGMDQERWSSLGSSPHCGPRMPRRWRRWCCSAC